MELVQQLLEYKMFKCISEELRERQAGAQKVFYKEPTIPEEVAAFETPVDVAQLMQDVTLQKLHAIFQSVLRRQEDKIDPIRSRFGRIEKEEVSLEDAIAGLREYAGHHHQFSFRQLLEEQCSKMEVIVTFLAILELMKAGVIIISQEHIFDDIQIESVQSGGIG